MGTTPELPPGNGPSDASGLAALSGNGLEVHDDRRIANWLLPVEYVRAARNLSLSLVSSCLNLEIVP
jgi:hypothetical protein